MPRTDRLDINTLDLGDSVMAFLHHSGVTRTSATFALWPGTRFYSLPSGLANASGQYGITTNPDGTTNLFINSTGFTTNGIMDDRLHVQQPIWGVTKHEFAIAGSLIGFWAGQCDQYDLDGTGVWSTIVPLLSTLTRLCIFLTGGGNDIITLLKGAMIDHTNAGYMALWDNTYIPQIIANYTRVIDFVQTHAGTNPVDLILPTYYNLRVQDGIPVTYVPHGDTFDPNKAPFRCAWLTDGFGAFQQAKVDRDAEIIRWANLVPALFGFRVGQLNLALGSDLVSNPGGNARSLDSLIHVNGTKNITNENINNVFHKLGTAQTTLAADYAFGGSKYVSTFNVIQFTTYDSLNAAFPPETGPGGVQSTVPLAYQSGNGNAFADVVHASKAGFEVYGDYIISQWFQRSQFDLASADFQATVGGFSEAMADLGVHYHMDSTVAGVSAATPSPELIVPPPITWPFGQGSARRPNSFTADLQFLNQLARLA